MRPPPLHAHHQKAGLAPQASESLAHSGGDAPVLLAEPCPAASLNGQRKQRAP